MLRQVISEDTSATMRNMLEQVVCDKVEGTGKNAYVSGYRIGGKTGTSTNTVKEAATGLKEYIVSFIGVAPMDDPQVCVLVLLRNPDESCGTYASGGNMGAPTVGRIMADILPYLGVEANYTEEEMQNIDRSVPSLVNMELSEAIALVESQNLTYRVIGSGATITEQLPMANSVVAAQSQIVLFAGGEKSEELEEVPDLTNLTYSIARQRLGYLALYINTDCANITNSQTVVVTRQSIPAGEMVEHGTVISVSLADTDASMNGQY